MRLPLKRASTSIELEARFIQIRFDPHQPDQLQSLWQWVDETILPHQTRRALLHNGLRVGKVVQPERVTSKLDRLESARQRNVVDQFLAAARVSSHQAEGTQTIPMRLGRRHELPVDDPKSGVHVVIVHDQPQPIGKTLLDPQFLFAITPRRGASASQIRLQLRPEVQHGDMQQDWVQGDAALRIDIRRQSWSLESIDLNLVGGEGDLFAISESSQRKGLGMQMFGGENVDGMQEQTILLLRIVNIPTPAERL